MNIARYNLVKPIRQVSQPASKPLLHTDQWTVFSGNSHTKALLTLSQNSSKNHGFLKHPKNSTAWSSYERSQEKKRGGTDDSVNLQRTANSLYEHHNPAHLQAITYTTPCSTNKFRSKITPSHSACSRYFNWQFLASHHGRYRSCWWCLQPGLQLVLSSQKSVSPASQIYDTQHDETTWSFLWGLGCKILAD